jgi:hypothetical protein
MICLLRYRKQTEDGEQTKARYAERDSDLDK